MDNSTTFKCYGDACKNVWVVIKFFYVVHYLLIGKVKWCVEIR